MFLHNHVHLYGCNLIFFNGVKKNANYISAECETGLTKYNHSVLKIFPYFSSI